MKTIEGYLRSDGKKGIRNLVLVVYTVECAHHVAREIVSQFRLQGVNLIGFGGCAPNSYVNDMMKKLCTHPNVGAVLLISLGCESMDKQGILEEINNSKRPAELLTIQLNKGTRNTIEIGQKWVSSTLSKLKHHQKEKMSISELVVGTICGGSDTTSGITANPAIGRAFDLLVSEGATAIFEETGELVGCEKSMCDRAIGKNVSETILQAMEKAIQYYKFLGYSSFSVGNSDGGLTTIEEKSLGAYSKSGTSPISGVIKPGETPRKPGLYLMDVVPDGIPKFGWPNINDNAEIVELIASGSHLILFSTARGSVVGSAISPVIKICANPQTYFNMKDDMDINAGKIINSTTSVYDIGEEIYFKILEVASGTKSLSERMGHQEFVLTYKQFDYREPKCLY